MTLPVPCVLGLLTLASCRTPPLTSDRLYDRPVTPDAPAEMPPAAPDVPAETAPVETAADAPANEVPPPEDSCLEEPALVSPPPACEPNRREAGFSGGVVDACEPSRTLNANVSIGGQRRCSGAGKGAFDFQLLQVGCKLTLVAARPGYQRYCRVITAPRAGYTIQLQRLGGCTAPFPGPTTCTCDEPGRQPYTGD
jgi:hypothetical protein